MYIFYLKTGLGFASMIHNVIGTNIETSGKVLGSSIIISSVVALESQIKIEISSVTIAI